ncbi:hypothetical protein ZIOFF_072916 [Zingiber officinale]|uniref:Nucleotidyl transferase domain-containing protein n=1 Tax=Zingiber officinale TaxID=94328 RepID=A0A8J5C342_ZINOF|nr:hypothetical protein ZIOFF_072916 [Zingiber officinale]
MSTSHSALCSTLSSRPWTFSTPSTLRTAPSWLSARTLPSTSTLSSSSVLMADSAASTTLLSSFSRQTSSLSAAPDSSKQNVVVAEQTPLCAGQIDAVFSSLLEVDLEKKLTGLADLLLASAGGFERYTDCEESFPSPTAASLCTSLLPPALTSKSANTDVKFLDRANLRISWTNKLPANFTRIPTRPSSVLEEEDQVERRALGRQLGEARYVDHSENPSVSYTFKFGLQALNQFPISDFKRGERVKISSDNFSFSFPFSKNMSTSHSALCTTLSSRPWAFSTPSTLRTAPSWLSARTLPSTSTLSSSSVLMADSAASTTLLSSFSRQTSSLSAAPDSSKQNVVVAEQTPLCAGQIDAVFSSLLEVDLEKKLTGLADLLLASAGGFERYTDCEESFPRPTAASLCTSLLPPALTSKSANTDVKFLDRANSRISWTNKLPANFTRIPTRPSRSGFHISMALRQTKGMRLSGEKEMLEAVFLADSFNLRFRPITLERPKVLLPLVNVPMIEYTLSWLDSVGVEEVFVFFCSHSQQVKDYLKESEWTKPTSRFSVTKSHDAISAGDALRVIYEKSVIHGDFVLISGDTISNLNLAQVLREHKERKKKDPLAVMTMIIKHSKPSNLTHQTRFGTDEVLMAIDPRTKELIFFMRTRCTGLIVQDIHNQLEGFCAQINLKILVLKDSCICTSYPNGCLILALRIEFLICKHIQLDAGLLAFLLQSHLALPVFMFMANILGYKIFTHEIHSSYAARIDSFRSFGTISKDILQRWTYPLVPNFQYFGNSSKVKLDREGIYKASDIV